MTEGVERMVVDIYSFHFRWNAKMQMMGGYYSAIVRPFVYVPTRYNTRDSVHEPDQRCTGAERESISISRRPQLAYITMRGRSEARSHAEEACPGNCIRV
jgi:hypothetical protein